MTDTELQRRILAVLPVARGEWNRGALLYRLGRAGGPVGDPDSEPARLLISIVERSVKSSAHQRRAALQGVARMLGPAGVDVYGKAIRDRDLFFQMLGIGASCHHDAEGVNAALVEHWTKRRLTGRHARKVCDLNELILAVRYFERIHQLDVVARLLIRHDDQLLPAERQVLEDIWPHAERARWASGSIGTGPDLSGLDGLGLPMQVFLEAEAAIAGRQPPSPPTPLTPEADAEEEREVEREFWELLQKLERQIERQR